MSDDAHRLRGFAVNIETGAGFAHSTEAGKVLRVIAERVEALTQLLTFVRIDGYDDEMGTYWCRAKPPCRTPITLKSGDRLQSECYHNGFPHAAGCPLHALVLVASKGKK